MATVAVVQKRGRHLTAGRVLRIALHHPAAQPRDLLQCPGQPDAGTAPARTLTSTPPGSPRWAWSHVAYAYARRVIRRTRSSGARTRASARRPWPGFRPVAAVSHKRADAGGPGRPGPWGRVGLGVGKAGDPMFAHALRPMQQPYVRLRGRRFRLDVLYRQQVPAGGLSGRERRGGRVDPGGAEVESAVVGGRVREARYPVRAHAAGEAQPLLLGPLPGSRSSPSCPRRLHCWVSVSRRGDHRGGGECGECDGALVPQPGVPAVVIPHLALLWLAPSAQVACAPHDPA